MNVTIHLHFGWLWVAFVISLVWLPCLVPIGNLLQREWWFEVVVISMLAIPILFVAALVSTIA